MRDTTKALIGHYVDHIGLTGQVLEIGGYRLALSAIEHFPEPRFTYHDLDIEPSDIPNTIVADITDCRDAIPDASFDLVVSSDVFEHIDRPWLAATEIARILKPGGLAITHTLFSWRNHPCPIDYWRFSKECLEFLFADLECLETGYDLSERRMDRPGFWPSGADSVPVDQLGGWREHWSVYHVGRKGPGPRVPRFKDSDHPLAGYLRMDTQGTVTNPAMRGVKPPPVADPLSAVRPELVDMVERLDGLEKLILDRSAQLEEISRRSQRLERRIDRVSASFPVRTALRVRRRLYKMLK
jgi:SAM-dependent methyltransferase